MRAWWLTLAVCGCIDTHSVVCGDGELCPSNTVCTPLPHITNAPSTELCATPDALAACTGKQDNDLCGTGGACHDGVCLPIACGNGYVDPGEACDDHNNASGDGCSADCLSNETCGNGVRDGITFEECDDGNRVNGDGCDSLCRAEQPLWKSIAINQITARKQTAMAFDAAHGQLVMFGGFDATNNVALSDTWLWNGSWTRATPHTVPPARQGHAMVYDAARHVTVMFGGNNGSATHPFSDTWEWDGHDWHASVTNQIPQRRDGAGLVYDGKRQRVLLFGGHVKTFDLMEIYFNDLWTYDGASWSQITTPTIPEPRAMPAMAYDPLRDQVVMFGGSSSGLIALKTWTFDGTDWHANAPAVQPVARYGARMAWDATTHTTAMFGGFTSADVNEMWLWSGTAWAQSSLATMPAARDTFGFAGDAAGGRLTLFGGNADALTWQWNGASWSNVTPYSAVPNPSAIENSFDLRRERTLVTLPGTTLASGGEGWSPIAQTIATPPSQPASAYDVAHDQMVMFGGTQSSVPSAQTWIGTSTTWTLVSPATSPPARVNMRLAYDAAHAQTILFGGTSDLNGNNRLGDTWMWDGTTWHPLSPAHSPSPRSAHEMAYDWIHQRIVLFGGTGTTPLNDTWTWDGTDWTELAPATVPAARSNAGFSYAPRRRSVVMIDDTTTFASDTWEWTGSDWAKISAGAGPEARFFPTVFPTHDGELYFGGGNASGIFNFIDAWRLEWDNTSLPETCVVPLDLDGDGLVGCADPDCYSVCNPTCLPGTTCDATQPHCGDGVCDPLETCRMCPDDCGACAAVCGDSFCDPGETAASCPGDCP